MIERLTLDVFSLKIFKIEKGKMDDKFLGNRPVIIDFYADWCGPCQTMQKMLDDISKEMIDDVDFYSVNVDDSGIGDVTRIFKVRNLPTLVYISADGEVQSQSGLFPERTMRENIKKFLKL